MLVVCVDAMGGCAAARRDAALDGSAVHDGGEARDGGDAGDGSAPGPAMMGASCSGGGAGLDTCPAGTGGESCCTSLEVVGGTYDRTYTNDGDGATGTAAPATVSSFRLDKYEVTVGRFRRYVSYLTGRQGAPPASGSGKHVHLNGGAGLANVGNGGGYEGGWDASSWDALIATGSDALGTWSRNLACDAAYATWAGSDDNLPINCVTWYEAYAFCIWDGGFLPSEAEWEYVAAGGSELREYPWGSSDPGTKCPGARCSDAVFGCDYPSGPGSCTGLTNIAPVGTASSGAGLWGQLDLAGNVWEWNLDESASAYVDPCSDCADTATVSNRVYRGGAFDGPSTVLLPPGRYGGASSDRFRSLGFRCARS
jgi:formylglycine-generating enzyme required for sulfatase activity